MDDPIFIEKLFLFLLGGIWRWIGIGFVSRGKEAFCLLKRRYKAADKSAKNIAIIAAKEPRFACPHSRRQTNQRILPALTAPSLPNLTPPTND